MRRNPKFRTRGAALVEMAVTVALLVLIAALALPKVGDAAKSRFRQVGDAIASPNNQLDIALPGGQNGQYPDGSGAGGAEGELP